MTSPVTWVHDNVLGFGDIKACDYAQNQPDWAIVHACKHPCHRTRVGYTNTLSKDHPHYLAWADERQLYLNLIDPPVPLFQLKSFGIFFDFVDRHLGQRPIVVHCNKGESRAPSFAMLILAKRLGVLPDESYAAARTAFEARFSYKPGGGISQFLEEHWTILGTMPGADPA